MSERGKLSNGCRRFAHDDSGEFDPGMCLQRVLLFEDADAQLTRIPLAQEPVVQDERALQTGCAKWLQACGSADVAGKALGAADVGGCDAGRRRPVLLGYPGNDCLKSHPAERQGDAREREPGTQHQAQIRGNAKQCFCACWLRHSLLGVQLDQTFGQELIQERL